MYAISFDMEIAKLKEHYGEPYNKAYDEIRLFMDDLGFVWAQGSLYICKSEVVCHSSLQDLVTSFAIFRQEFHV